MMKLTEKYIESVIDKIAKQVKFDEWTYRKEEFEDIAQNYFGVLIPINLNGKSHEKNSGNVNISLVLKLAPTDERYRVSGAIELFFAKEIFVYTKILQKYQDIQRTFPAAHLFVMPKCYYVCNDYCKEFLALENMCMKNYKPFVRNMFLDVDHINVALISLARLHALSYIFKENERNLFNETKEFCVPLSEKTNKRFMTILVDRLEKALIKFNNSKYVPLLEGLRQNCVSIFESAIKLVKSECLCHGDIWKENILFKYEENMPISACIIDYQTTRICSPAFDVLYLIITSTTSSLRKSCFKNMLDIYYQTFEQTLAYANLKAEEIYSREMLEYDFKIVGPICLIIANTAIWLASGLQEEGHVKSKRVLSTDTAKFNAANQYKDIMRAIIDDLSEYNFLNTVFL